MRYLLPTVVVDYIEEHGLYLDEGSNSASNANHSDKGKDREPSTSGGKNLSPIAQPS